MRSRRVLAFGIVVLWVALVGWMVRREYFQPELARLAEAALALNPGTSFYTLRMNERAVGLATSRLDTVPGGFVLEDRMQLELPALGQQGTAIVRTRVDLGPSLQMRAFSFDMNSDVGVFRATGEVVGDSLLHVSINTAGSEQTVSYRLAQPPVFAAVLPIRLALGEGLRVGESYRMPIFDPSSLSTRTVEIRVVEHDTLVVPGDSVEFEPSGRFVAATLDTIPVWKIAEVYGGVQLESWIDDDGRIVRASSALGFSMEKTAYELAQQALNASRLAGASAIDDDVILSTAIQSNVDLGSVETHEELRFLLSGVDLEGFQLHGGRQTLRGDTLIVRREDWAGIDAGYSLPYKRMDLREALEPEPLIQSDDERIVERARSITDWRTRWQPAPKQAAGQLTRGVYGMLAKEVTFSIPSALQVLESRRGDCNEHTVLYVALARALGLPARTAVGLVYLNGSFFYHAWPEVWLGEWVAVDPTFNQTPADAAHIRFVIGGLAQQVEIVRLIGRLNIEVLPPGSGADEGA